MKVRMQHTSMQFSDTTAHKRADAHKIFVRAAKEKVAWCTGTESGQQASGDLRTALAKEAKDAGYKFTVIADLWIAVRKDLIIKGSWDQGFIRTLESNTGSQTFSDRGISWVQFDNHQVGRVSVGCSHYMTNGRHPGDEYYRANARLTEAIGTWGRKHGAGSALAFYAADTNVSDRQADVFRGSPFTTIADELRDWKDTGHGSIDVIASYNADGRVSALRWTVLDDRQFFLNTDHYLCEAIYEVRT